MGGDRTESNREAQATRKYPATARSPPAACSSIACLQPGKSLINHNESGLVTGSQLQEFHDRVL